MSEPKITRIDQDHIAILTIDRPPVNALSQALKVLLVQQLDQLAQDANVKGVVLTCAGRTFIAGADIAELGKVLPPLLPDVVAQIEALPMPSIAAIHGTALGGGLEVALGCTFRIAAQDCKFGLPEVKLGFLPGAGGTVRGTYLVGAEALLNLAGSGEMIGAPKAQEIGLIDGFSSGNLVQDAVAFLQDKIAANDIPLPISQRKPKLTDSGSGTTNSLAKIEAALCRKMKSTAPALVAQSVRNAVEMPFADAMKAERALSLGAVTSSRSIALRHLFFAERAASKPTGEAAEAAPREVQNVGIIGAGTMGGGIAMAFANAGFNVTIRETDQTALNRGCDRIKTIYAGSVKRGSITAEIADQRLARIRGTIDVNDLADADLIVEAAFEDIDVKRTIFLELDTVMRPGAILATNTSYLDVNAIAGFTKRAQDVVGLHFFSPANVMRLLEIVQGAETAPDVIATALKVARRLGKQPVVVGVCHGFVGNRMLAARNSQMAQLLLEGASPEQIDGAFRAFGWPMGPCQMQDLAGLDISWRTRKALGKTDALPDRLCELGRFGQKTAKGWYAYKDGDRTPHPDPEVLSIIRDIAAKEGIKRRTLIDAEIIERTHAPMIAEGHAIVNEGIAACASDIDVIWTAGYGFPRDLGGPMHWDSNKQNQ